MTQVSNKENYSGFFIFKHKGECHKNSRFQLYVGFCGKYQSLQNYATEEIADRVAAYALEHIARFEQTGNIYGFRLFVRQWAVAHGYKQERLGFSVHRNKNTKKFSLSLNFNGKHISVISVETEEIARAVAAYALERKVQFERTRSSHDFTLLIRSWAVAQGFQKKTNFTPSAFPEECKPAVEALIELRKEIQIKQKSAECPRESCTKAQEATIREMHPNHTFAEIAEKMGKSKAAVQFMASKIGLQKQIHKSYSASDEATIRELYQTKTAEEIAEILDRTTFAVKRKIRAMGLRKYKKSEVKYV